MKLTGSFVATLMGLTLFYQPLSDPVTLRSMDMTGQVLTVGNDLDRLHSSESHLTMGGRIRSGPSLVLNLNHPNSSLAGQSASKTHQLNSIDFFLAQRYNGVNAQCTLFVGRPTFPKQCPALLSILQCCVPRTHRLFVNILFN